MAWYNPATWFTVGQIVTKANLDALVRDNLRYLHGDDGATTLANALILPDGAGYYLHIPSLTTTQRDALTPTAGMLVYNSTTTQFNKYENGAWRSDLGFNSHHGDLSGLTDDDHTIYQKESLLTTAGDIPYATADSTWARLGIGTASQILRTNAGATAPEWTANAAATSSSGSYAGNNAADRAVAHGLGIAPRLVTIFAHIDADTWYEFTEIVGLNNIYGKYLNATAIAVFNYVVAASTTTNFYVGDAASYTNTANATGTTYYWVAIG